MPARRRHTAPVDVARADLALDAPLGWLGRHLPNIAHSRTIGHRLDALERDYAVSAQQANRRMRRSGAAAMLANNPLLSARPSAMTQGPSVAFLAGLVVAGRQLLGGASLVRRYVEISTRAAQAYFCRPSPVQ